MSDKKKTKLPSMIRTMSIAPESIDNENRTVEVVWTTGARAIQFNWDFGGEFIEELEISEQAINMERLNSGSAPFLNMHDGWNLSSVLGVVEKAWIDGKEGRAVIRFPKGDEDIDKIWNLVAQRIICNISVGYTVEEYEKYEEDGKFIYRAIKWTPLELSAVTVPADAKANVRAHEIRTSDCLITTRSTTKEKIMTKRSENEEDITDEIVNDDEIRSDEEGQDPDENGTPADENREDGNEDEENREDDENKDCRSAKNSISRRDFIYGLCEAAGLSITTARKFNESKAPLSEIRLKILNQRSGNVAKISNSRGMNNHQTKTLSQRSAEVYAKGK